MHTRRALNQTVRINFLVYADDVNLLDERIRITKKNMEVLSFTSKENVSEENALKTKYMFISYEENAGQYHNLKIGHISFESVEHLKYLRTTIKDQNSIHVEIKNKFNLGNVCYRPLFYAP